MAQQKLTMSGYDISPAPAAVTEQITFTATATAFGDTQNAVMEMELPSNVDFSGSTAPSGCEWLPSSTSPTSLSCKRGSVAQNATWQVQFTGKAKTVGVVKIKASVKGDGSAPHQQEKDVTVLQAADLSVKKTGPTQAAAGERISFVLSVNNAGPGSASTISLKDQLPDASNFELESIAGSGWACSTSTGICTRASLGANTKAPDVTVTGRVKISGGTLTNNASVSMSSTTVRDPNPDNDKSQAQVKISAAVDLQAHKTMVNAVGRTTFSTGETVTLTLSASNQGVMEAQGVAVTDTVPAGFTDIVAVDTATASACTIVGNQITCRPGSLAAGAKSAIYTFTMKAPATVVAAGKNTAEVSRTGPTGGANKPADVNYVVVKDFARLELGKKKSSGPILVGEEITSTIDVRYDKESTLPASGTVTVSEKLSPQETYVRTDAPWTCTGVPVGGTGTLTCTHVLQTPLSGSNMNAPALKVVTKISDAGVAAEKITWPVENEACMGNTHEPSDVSGKPLSCEKASTDGTRRKSDLGITKTADKSKVTIADESYSYELLVTNHGPDVAPTVTVKDSLKAYFSGSPSTGVVVSAANGGAICNSNAGSVSCTILNMAVNASQLITVKLTRPFKDGDIGNTAYVSSKDAYDSNLDNNNSSVTVNVDPKTDVLVQSTGASPAFVQVGVKTTFTTEIKNQGPSTAQNVKIYQLLEKPGQTSDRLVYTPGSAKVTNATGAVCTYETFGPDAPAGYAGGKGLVCTIAQVAPNASYQLTFDAMPSHNGAGGYPDPLTSSCSPNNATNSCAKYETEATVTTTTPESEANNNRKPGSVTVAAKQVDLFVQVSDPGYDPVGFGSPIQYKVDIANLDASLATGVVVNIKPVAPAGATMVFDAVVQKPNGMTCTAPKGDGSIDCFLGSSRETSTMPGGSGKQTITLRFKTAASNPANPPAGIVEFKAEARIWSYETGDDLGGDLQPLNNKSTEPTTALPVTDLHLVSKTVSKTPVMLNEPFQYTVTFTNKGPSLADMVEFVDRLPAGLTTDIGPGRAIVVKKSGVAVVANVCVPDLVSVSCEIPSVASGMQVTVEIPVVAKAEVSGGAYTQGFDIDRINTASVDVPKKDGVPTSSWDPDPSNNSATAVVQIQQSQVTGKVEFLEGSVGNGSWKPVPEAVTVLISGKDKWGNDVAKTVTTVNGVFTFDGLPPSGPGGYTVVQTQPSGYFDYLEKGPVGATLPPATCNGTANCSAAQSANTIGTIVVGDKQIVDGLVFQEFKPAQVAGSVYEDKNNNGRIDGQGEPKIAAASTIELTGTAYNGQALTALSQQSNASGYAFNNLPPSNASGYTVKQTTEPAGYVNGQVGVQPESDAFNQVGQVPAEGQYKNTIEKIVVFSAGKATGNNFGELKAASLSGYTFIDANKNGARDPGEEAGVTGMQVSLTGQNIWGETVNLTATTGNNGFYEFKDLVPGSYAVTVTPLAGMNHVGAQIGSLNGEANGVTGVNKPVLGATSITKVELASDSKGSGYNFGQSGEGLSGKVYVDLNKNGIADNAEPGIPGVTISLSGKAQDGRDICDVIHPKPCTAVTDSEGGYIFVGLPASDAQGYTLTEQAQSTAPLNRYADGKETAGTVGGSTAVNDVISGIQLRNTFASGYNFGEIGIDLPGHVFVDSNGDGKPNGSETPLPGVTITLTGTTVDGQAICTIYKPCTVTTGPDGKFVFPGLPAGNYDLIETQPRDYTDGLNTPGNAGGTASFDSNSSKISGIKLTTGQPPVTDYLFAEKAGSLSGSVYNDRNSNGVRDAEDPGIAGVSVTLTGITASGEPVTQTTTTDADGRYHFDNLKNGTYEVTETQPKDWLDGKHSQGVVGGSACTSCDNSQPNTIKGIVFTTDKPYTDFNFGEVKSTSITGTVYHDVNEDGKIDPQEGLAGVEVTLTGKDDQGKTVHITVTTDENGKYSFPDLRPSDSNGYTITETQPLGVGDFSSGGAQPGLVNGKPVGSSNQPNVITGVVLKSGEPGEDYNFRDKASSLSGTVYRDDNDNGVKDGNEPGLPGVTVTLTGTTTAGQTITKTVVTDENGNYSFVGLPAGDYKLVETQPPGMLDGRETAGPNNNGTVDNAKFCDDASCNSISNIKVGEAEKLTGYLFGERGGSLAGTVYVDKNNSGTQDAGEEGLPGVKIMLSGKTATGEDICVLRGAAFCTALTDANGHYKFEGVPPGSYQLVKSQNQVNELFANESGAKYADGKETAGVVGGKVENRYFGTQPGYNTIGAIELTPEGITANAGNIGGYLFGVRPATGAQGLLPPVVSGYVYMDKTHDRVRDPMDTEGQEGWTVNLSTSTGTNICTVQTDAKGFYQFDNLRCPGYASGLPTSDSLPGNPSFNIHFSKDGNVLPNMASSGDKAGVAGGAKITNLVLRAADEVVEQNLPLDPEGVVYDAVTRKPVAGAVIGMTYTGSGVFDPSVHLVGGSAAQSQSTGPDGRYSFVLQNNFPSGEYVLTINGVPSAYLPGQSVMIPACVNALNVTLLPMGLPALMQGQRDAPGVSQAMHDAMACPVSSAGFSSTGPFAPSQQTTQYYLRFVITNGGSSEILNNHIPLDPVLAGGALLVTKTTPKVNVAKGDLVPYTITATNMSGGALSQVRVRDLLPAGFRYRMGTASSNGLPVEPEVRGRELTWPNQNFAINEKKSYQLVLVVGAGVGEGEYVNQAWAINSTVNERISNVANAAVRVTPDATFDCSDLIGTVFDDKNANGYQDQGERGIPNVRVVTARGLLVTTDAEGRFHVACAAIPQADRGSNFVMKLDERTLPTGFRVTTENPRDVRVTRGKMVKLNFGATVHKVLRLEVDARAFEDAGTALAQTWLAPLQQVVAQLVERPSVLRIAYRSSSSESASLVEQRLKALAQRVRDDYAQAAQHNNEKENGTPPLVIETESFDNGNAQGVR